MTNERVGEVEGFGVCPRAQQLRVQRFINRGEGRIFIQFGNRGRHFERKRTFEARTDGEQTIGVVGELHQATSNDAPHALGNAQFGNAELRSPALAVAQDFAFLMQMQQNFADEERIALGLGAERVHQALGRVLVGNHFQ